MTFRIRRAYEPRLDDDELRVLVDRLWPRGVAKAAASWDEWLKDVAPSARLRRWYGHLPERFAEFTRAYEAELDDDEHREAVDRLLELGEHRTVTLLTATRDVAASHVPTLEKMLRTR